MLTLGQVAAIKDVEKAWPTALGFYVDMTWRKTDDVDLVLAIDMDEFVPVLDKLPGWKSHKTKEHRFYSPRGEQLDLLPAGPKAIEQGAIAWFNEHVMNIEAMDLAFAHAESHRCLDAYTAQVAPPPVVVLLKMSAVLDNPERGRDVADIKHLLELYVDMEKDPDRFWAEAVDWELDADLLAAHVLGKDIRAIAGTVHLDLVSRFLDEFYGGNDDNNDDDATDQTTQDHQRLKVFKAAIFV